MTNHTFSSSLTSLSPVSSTSSLMEVVMEKGNDEEEEEIVFERTAPQPERKKSSADVRRVMVPQSSTLSSSYRQHRKPRDQRQSYVPPMTMSMRLADLIKALWSADANIVTASLMQIHALVDGAKEQSLSTSPSSELSDNTLELGVVRKGGQLALLHALQTHPTVPAIQALALNTLSWLCETCNIKSALVGKGAVPLACNILQQQTNKSSSSSAQMMVLAEALYFLGHLSTLPKVAEQVAVRDAIVLDRVVACLSRCSIDDGSSANDDSAVDAMFFLCQRLAAHHSMVILKRMWHAGCLTFTVRHLQDSVAEYQAHNESLEQEQARIEAGCRILTSWTKTKCKSLDRSHIVQRLIEAGALTVAAELVRLFPLGTPLRRVANPCLRAMVPVSED